MATARDLAAWYPEIPAPHLKFPDEGSLIWPEHPEDPPASLAILGGSEGRDLCQVVGLNLFMHERLPGPDMDLYECVVALEVCFADRRTPVWLGPELPQWTEKRFFAVDGPGGEYITHVGAIPRPGGDVRYIYLKASQAPAP
jgi:hypothetical protein